MDDIQILLLSLLTFLVSYCFFSYILCTLITIIYGIGNILFYISKFQNYMYFVFVESFTGSRYCCLDFSNRIFTETKTGGEIATRKPQSDFLLFENFPLFFFNFEYRIY